MSNNKYNTYNTNNLEMSKTGGSLASEAKESKKNAYILKFKSDSVPKNPDDLKEENLISKINEVLSNNGVSNSNDLVTYCSKFSTEYRKTDLSFNSEEARDSAIPILEANASNIIAGMVFTCAYKNGSSSRALTTGGADTGGVTLDARADLKSRFYENKLPVPGETVMVHVISIDDIGATVELIEYKNKSGLIQISDLSKSRMRSVNAHIQEDKVDIAQIQRVEKGYIDLAKKTVEKKDREDCLERYHKSNQFHLVLRVVADLNKEYLEKLADDINKTLIYDPETEVKRPRTEEDKVNILECLYEKIGWPMYRLCREKKVEYSHPLDALKIIAVIAMKEKNKKEQSAGETSESEKLTDSNASEALVESNFGLGAVEWKVFGFLMSDPTLRPLIFSLLSYVKAKLAPKSMKVAAEIELTCFAYEGVEAIKEALNAGTSVSTEDITITANYVSSPKFYIIAQSLDKDRGVELCNKALEIIKETIERYNGNLVVKKAPELITSEKEKELFSMAGKIEEESSDDDDDHADDGQEWRDEDT
jgi:translation initiation factor 2 subunit 1